MKVNYDEISKKYDDVREADVSLIQQFSEEIDLNGNTRVLDFGCGTGNYADKLQRIMDVQMFGVEPSEGMRKRAEAKNPNILLKDGNHEKIPFQDAFFDFVYMTDVIHHVPDLGILFKELGRVLKKDGRLCIVTQSHAQIENRFFVKYFPSTAQVDKKRYPAIESIIAAAKQNGHTFLKQVVHNENDILHVGNSFLEIVRNKGFSMFHLIPEEEYTMGLRQLERALEGSEFTAAYSGDTLLWFQKEA